MQAKEGDKFRSELARCQQTLEDYEYTNMRFQVRLMLLELVGGEYAHGC
jgi:hypothetical protein